MRRCPDLGGGGKPVSGAPMDVDQSIGGGGGKGTAEIYWMGCNEDVILTGRMLRR